MMWLLETLLLTLMCSPMLAAAIGARSMPLTAWLYLALCALAIQACTGFQRLFDLLPA